MLDKKARDAREIGSDTPPGRRRRADRAVETRRKLLDAAAKVVGAEGYANASVARITALADIAQGTFYNYFASQQDLFDQLLPELGTELLDFIRARVAGEADSLKREAIGFRAFFDFVAERPEFYRILNEAETFAPKAYHDHMRNMGDGYTRALMRSHAKGELTGFEPRELEVIVYSLLAARNYLSYRYLFRDKRVRRLPAWVDNAYMKLVTGGMMQLGSARLPRGRRAQAAGRPAPIVTDRFPIVSSAPGQVRIEVELSDECRDDTGNVRSALMLELIEAAATAAASDLADDRLQLLSLSTAFPSAAESESLTAIATARVSGTALHVSVEVREPSAEASPVATAQAVYTTSSAHKSEHES